MEQEGKAFFAFSEEADEVRKNNLEAITRTIAHIERCHEFIRQHPQDKAFQSLHGIKAVSIFTRLKTMLIPHAFPPDHMHLTVNVAKLMVEIYNGSIFQKNATGNQEANNEDGNVKASQAQKPPRRKRRASAPPNDGSEEDYSQSESDAASALDTDADASEDEEFATIDAMDEDFIIPKDGWDAIGADQERSKSSIPASIGEVDNIAKYMGSMSSASWFSWTLNQSLVYFYDRLPPRHFAGYSNFVQIVRLSGQRRLYHHEIDQIDTLVRKFITYFENEIYKFDIKRIHVWRPVVHQLMHITEAIRNFGPMSSYSQWTIERYHQRIKVPLQRGRASPNVHLSNVVCDWQCLNAMAFVLPLVGGIAGVNLNSLEGDIFADEFGNLKISALFKKAMLHDDAKVAELLEEERGEEGDPGVGGIPLNVAQFVRTDRPWYPRDLHVNLPRPRPKHPRPPLPFNALSENESDDSSTTDTDGEAAVAVGVCSRCGLYS